MTPSDDVEELGRQMVRFMRLMHKVKSQVAKQSTDGIEHAAYALLFNLVHDGPQRTSQLAETMHLEISTISRQISALVSHGLVERTADPGDGRACLLQPTQEGYRIFEENRKQRNRWLAQMIGDWDDADRKTLNTLLGRLNDGIEHLNPQLGAATARAKGDNA
ncbi:MarR family winged helix-turn-helix transcriptional regulator [Amycolatopsis suaedae]|uniref:MarR family transcriptional regulator n=1 Tax=Amycolatopsis suaedae TaxID=2510978 RepID=A0A4Q7JCX5_9PSEU|nr:MarR family transcriptional regulator [Amycolatopsis suaedae]RZQ65219.1 MarR family transcriptional regulator [Amycolatopsis suaedae]